MTLIIDVSCRGVDQTRRLQLEEGEEIVVGRDNSELILRKDQTLSRRHFALRYANGSITVKHLSKTNPTLMASEGSSEFQRISETQIESRTCRIIAGHHRFVATLESYESATISGDINEIWSDFEEQDEVQEVEQAKIKPPVLDSENNKTVEQIEKPVFTWDDSVDEQMESPTIVDVEVKPRKPEETLPKGPTSLPKDIPAPNPRSEPIEPPKKVEQPDSFPDDFFD